MKQVTVEQLLDIGIALTKEKDGDSLLERILTTAMEIVDCDAGTLYIKTGDKLSFRLMITKSRGIYKGGRYGPIDLPPVPLSRRNVCACAVLDRKLFCIPDGYDTSTYDFSGPREYDAITGYRTTSMMVVPMEDDQGGIIGVLQLLNALDENRNAIPFGSECEEVIWSLASQAAICLTNMNYAKEVRGLMDSFVRVMSTAIDARTPYNANHTRKMAHYGEGFLRWLDTADRGWRFSEGDKRQFLMSVWLHDIGKLVVPLEIMDKSSRLGDQSDHVFQRFRDIALLDHIAFLEHRITEEEYERRKLGLSRVQKLVDQANRIYILSDELLEELEKLRDLTYQDENGNELPWLSSDELKDLSIRRGNLTPEEREIMESHVVMTAKMLGEMQFAGDYAEVPEWAGDHHEFLNGTGYPRGLKGEEIPKEARLLTILDIYDALTAKDRPYAPPMTVEHAFATLENMVREGELDGDILALFIESRAWEETL